MKAVSNQERFRILSQPLIGNTDIQKVVGVCKAKATEIINEINKQVRADGKQPHDRKVSSKRVMQYLDINMDEVIFLAKKEIEIMGMLPATAGGAV